MEKDVFKSYIPIFIFLPNYKFFEIQRKVGMNSHLKPETLARFLALVTTMVTKVDHGN